MPVMECSKDGQSGFKWGESGACYIGPDARSMAEKQGLAVEASRGDSMIEYREDFGGAIESHIDENGYLRITGVAARTGILTYMLPGGGMRRELVPAETLFAEDSVSTLSGSPVTVEHPGVLTAETAQQYSRGSVPAAKADGDKLKVDVVVTAQDAIDTIQAGKRQLSPGYRAELDFTPGEYEGQRYDAVQVKRVYNHLAIVQSARGGSECRLHLDSLNADGINCAVEINQPTTEEVHKMPTVKLHSGATVEVADASTATALQTEINQLSDRADAADGMVEKSKYDELQGKYDAMAEEMETLKGKSGEKMDSDEIGAYIETVDNAKKLKPDVEVKQDGAYLSEVEVMAAAMGIDAKDKSPEYIKGRFDSAVELAGKDSIRQQRETRTDSADPVLTGRQKFMQEQQKRG